MATGNAPAVTPNEGNLYMFTAGIHVLSLVCTLMGIKLRWYVSIEVLLIIHLLYYDTYYYSIYRERNAVCTWGFHLQWYGLEPGQQHYVLH